MSFTYQGRKVVLKPLTPKEIHEDHLIMKSKRGEEKEKVKLNCLISHKEVLQDRKEDRETTKRIEIEERTKEENERKENEEKATKEKEEIVREKEKENILVTKEIIFLHDSSHDRGVFSSFHFSPIIKLSSFSKNFCENIPPFSSLITTSSHTISNPLITV